MKEDFKKRFQQKYPHLEVSILSLSEAEKDNETKRIDSEFFIKKYIENEILIKNFKNGFNYLDAFIVKISGGATPLGANYPENGIPFLRVQNIMENYFSLDDVVYISAEDDEILKRSRLKSNDVLLTITGAYGKSAVVEDELVGANINQHSVKIEVKNINPYFLSTFLNSKFGKLQSDKRITGVTRPALDYLSIKTFLIPNFDYSFQKEIENIIKDSHSKSQQSKSLYKEAESILYTELGLDPQDPLKSILEYEPTPNVSVHSLKESFLKTGRLDSEYYQAKYDLIERKIKDYKNGCITLQKADIKDQNFAPEDEKIYKYIELSNITSNGNISNPTQEIGKNLPSRAKRLVEIGDVIISSVEGCLSSCAFITKEFDNCVASNGFYIIKNPYINGETLLILFKSSLFQEYLRKFPTGTILTAISKDELQNILIPKIDPSIQTQIAQNIQKSFTLRTQSKILLQEAKEKVELTISRGGGQLEGKL